MRDEAWCVIVSFKRFLHGNLSLKLNLSDAKQEAMGRSINVLRLHVAGVMSGNIGVLHASCFMLRSFNIVGAGRRLLALSLIQKFR